MSSGNGVPFVDLVTPHRELEDELVDAVRSVIRSAAFVGGEEVDKFESEYAASCGVDFCVGVGSGTDALRFGLIAAGVEAGDVVVTVPNTFVATVEAILQARATPHFVDVDPDTCNMDVECLRDYLRSQCDVGAGRITVHRSSGRRVRAIVPVHLYGQMCNMDPIMALADEFGLLVVEDACQAHGAEYYSSARSAWQKAGSIGIAGAFSFYPGKNLGACGEAGAVTTNDPEVAARLRMIRDHGQNRKYHHVMEGYNGRLDAVQAAILRVKLPHLSLWNAARQRSARIYRELLASVESIRLPHEPEWSRSVYHLYVIHTPDRDGLQGHLTGDRIGAGLHYPIPLHIQPACEGLGYRRGDFLVSERTAAEGLSLPMFPQLERQQQEWVAESVHSFASEPAALSRGQASGHDRD